MFKENAPRLAMLLLIVVLGFAALPSEAAIRIEGQVQAGGGPLANSTVALWAASAGEPRRLAQTRANSDGRFELGTQETLDPDVILYIVAKGGEAAVNKGSGNNSAAALLAVLGNVPPSRVVINEMTTVASVWTTNQFINGTAIRGTRSVSRLPQETSRTLSIFKPADGAQPFRTRSTAAKRPQWPTSPRSRPYWPGV